MADKPIPFFAPMVRALLDGRKTQTRRVLKPQPTADTVSLEADGKWWVEHEGADLRYPLPLPYAVGDRLWVREAWRVEAAFDDRSPNQLPIGEIVAHQYEADGKRMFWRYDHLPIGRYRHARFMPRWASRLTLTVTDVRVQRVQDISEAEAEAEGVTPHEKPNERRWEHYVPHGVAFTALWNSIHGPDAWARNDWVAAYTFTVEKRNIDHDLP